ncbi:MAG: S49 family peptidase [Pseudomonadota bacterium]
MTDQPGSESSPSSPSPAAPVGPSILERLAFASLDEQRLKRRWGIFFKLLFLSYVILITLVITLSDRPSRPLVARYTALVELEGTIEPDSAASADNVIAGLRAAFEDKGTVGVIIRANSPGGTPVQAAFINDEIRRLRKKYPKIPVYAVVEDVCASGCYYAVVAADKIYADRSSVVGSIGVLMNGFGFTDAIRKLGIERRLLTSGEHKGLLDPFQPMKPEDKAHAQRLLRNIHQQFIARVREGRKDALRETPLIYSGLYWTGDEALKLGLIDDIGNAGFVAREIIKAETIVDFTRREGLFDRFARRFGTAVGKVISTDLLGHTPVLK